jgi:uncharacterized protein (DUF1330 family)
MRSHYTVTLAMIAGFGVGAVAVHGLHAQAKPPVYSITEIEVADQEGYMKDYAPRAAAALQAAGARYIVRGGKTYSFVGEPPKRVVVLVWDSIEKFQAYRDSAAAKELEPVLQKYGKFHRSFAVEGVTN